jgi:hypothetical protein
VTEAPPPGPPPGWYADPHGGGAPRWWDGTRWTDAVHDAPGPADAAPTAADDPGPRWQPLGSLATALAVLLGIAAVANTVAALAFASRAALVGHALTATAAELEVNDTRVGLAIGAVMLTGLGTYVLWCVWFHAAYRDAETLHPVRFRGWAVWGWLVPVVSLFRPKQMVNDAWRAAHAHDHDDDHARTGGVAPLVHAWWVTWLLGLALFTVGQGVARSAEPADRLRALGQAARVDSAALALLALASLLGLLMARRLSAALERRHSARSEPPSTGTTQPVTYDAAGESRNAATLPNSSGAP